MKILTPAVPTLGFAALAALAALTVSCGGAAHNAPGKASMAAEPCAAPDRAIAGADWDGDPRGEIAALSQEIEQMRTAAGMSPQPESGGDAANASDPEAMAAAGANPRAPQQGMCGDAPEPSGATCGDVCRLGRSICTNAARICRLAGQLPGDAWAADKCSTASASCAEARGRCCGCAE